MRFRKSDMACKGLLAMALAGAVFSWCGGTARADEPTAIGPDGISGGGVDDMGRYLGPVYKDEIAGIKLAPPVGSRIIKRAGMELVSFVIDAKQWGGNVQIAMMKQPTTVEAYLSSVAGELSKSFRAVQVLDTREITFQNHKAGRIATSMEAELGAAPNQPGGGKGGAGETIALFRQQLIVQMSDKQFMVLTLYTPLKDRDLASSTFNAMLTSFELLDRNALAKQREVAVKVGKQWLAQRSAEELTSKLNPQPQMFRIKVGGNDVGYVRFDEKETKRDNSKGVQLEMNSRSFPADGSITYGQNIAYWAYSGNAPVDRRPQYSSWENTVKTVTNRPNVPRANQTFWVTELGTLQLEGISRFSDDEIAELRKQREEMLKQNLPADRVPPPIEVPRKQYRIQVNYSGDDSQTLPKPLDASIPVERPALLPKILEYMWPRVVDLTKPVEMTFVVYNSATRKLTYRTLSVIGKDHIAVDRKPTDCFRCLDEMDNTSTTLWVDAEGKILLMRTSDQSLLLPTTADEMERLWATKLRGT